MDEQAYKLTPVESHEGILVKRDDLFRPFGPGGPNGGKLRQCYSLIKERFIKGTQRVFTGCSVHSPQGPLIAAMANHFGLDCHIFIGARNSESAMKHPMIAMAVDGFGAKLHFVSSGRHNVLYHRIRKVRESLPGMIIEYGVNLEKNYKALVESTARQAKNLPNELERLVMTCGSGVSSTGVIVGLKRYEKKVKETVLIGTAPNRLKKIHSRLSSISRITGHSYTDQNIKYIDLYSEKGFLYERSEPCNLGEIELHPNYEAKVYARYIKALKKGELAEVEQSLFWIVGAKPQGELHASMRKPGLPL